jgi:hypothetical protein
MLKTGMYIVWIQYYSTILLMGTIPLGGEFSLYTLTLCLASSGEE